MAEYRLSPDAEAELDGIWLYIARESRNIDIANRVVDRLTEHFWSLARHPYMGRAREELGPGLRSFPAENYVIFHRIDPQDVVLIVHVLHSSRDIESFFSH